MLGLGSNTSYQFPAARGDTGKQLAADRAKVTKSKWPVEHSVKSIPVGSVSWFCKVSKTGLAAEQF